MVSAMQNIKPDQALKNSRAMAIPKRMLVNCRSSDSFSLSMGLLRNKGIWLVTGVLLLMQLVIIYVPLMQSMFGTEALPLRYWFVTLVIGVAMFLVVEVEKRLTRRFRKTA